MAGQLTIDTLKASSGVLATQNAMTGIAKAWVNFNGTSGASPVIRASFNVSSVTRTATGEYTITFSTAMSDANYVMTGNGVQSTFNNYDNAVVGLNRSLGTSALTTTACYIRCTNNADSTGNSAVDLPTCVVSVIGN